MIRKITTFVDEIAVEGGKAVKPAYRAAAAAAIISNPFAGKYVDELIELREEYSKLLAHTLVPRVMDAIAFELDEIDIACFGKAALVGINGEIEHGSAIIHNMDFGGTFRDIIGGGDAMIPSVEKRGMAGATLDIPLKNRHDASRAYYHQTMEIRVPDGPGADEILIAAAISLGTRPHPGRGISD